MPDEQASIRLGVIPEGFSSATQQINSLYRTAESGLRDLVVQADDFGKKWEDLWQRQPSGDAMRAFTTSGGQAFREMGEGAQKADREIAQLQERASELQTVFQRMSEEGIDTSGIQRQTEQLQNQIQSLQRVQREQAPMGEAMQGRARVGEGIPGQEMGGIFRNLQTSSQNMAESFDEITKGQETRQKWVPEGEGFALRRPEGDGKGVSGPTQLIDQANVAFFQLLQNLQRFNRHLQEGTRQTRRGTEEKRQQVQVGQVAGGTPGLIQSMIQRHMPRGMLSESLMRRFGARGAAQATSGQVATGGGGMMARLGGRGGGAAAGGAARAAGGMAMGGAALAVAAALAALAAVGLIYRGLRGQAERFERTVIGAEQVARRLGAGTGAEFRGMTEMLLPGATGEARGRYERIRGEFGVSRAEMMRGMGQIEAPSLVGAGGRPQDQTAQVETLMRGMAGFSRLQGQDVTQAASLANQLGKAGLSGQGIAFSMNALIGETMSEGLREGIARSETMRAIMDHTQQTVRSVGEANQNAVANASAMVEAFTETGVGAFMPGRGGAGQRMVGGIAAGANDPTQFSMFARALMQASTAQGFEGRAGLSTYLEQSYAKAVKDPVQQEIFAELMPMQQMHTLQQTLTANTHLLGQVLPQLLGTGEEGVSTNLQVMLTKAVTGNKSTQDAINVIAAMRQGLAENLVQAGGRLPEAQELAQQLRGGRGISPLEAQRLRQFDSPEGRKALRERLSPEEFEETRRLSMAQQLATGQQPQFVELSDTVSTVRTAINVASDAADERSKNASTLTAAIAGDVAQIREDLARFTGGILRFFGMGEEAAGPTTRTTRAGEHLNLDPGKIRPAEAGKTFQEREFGGDKLQRLSEFEEGNSFKKANDEHLKESASGSFPTGDNSPKSLDK